MMGKKISLSFSVLVPAWLAGWPILAKLANQPGSGMVALFWLSDKLANNVIGLHVMVVKRCYLAEKCGYGLIIIYG